MAVASVFKSTGGFGKFALSVISLTTALAVVTSCWSTRFLKPAKGRTCGLIRTSWLVDRDTAAGTAPAVFSAAEMINSAAKKLVGKAETIVSATEKSISVAEMTVSTTDIVASYVQMMECGPETTVYVPSIANTRSKMTAFASEMDMCKAEIVASALQTVVSNSEIIISGEPSGTRSFAGS